VPVPARGLRCDASSRLRRLAPAGLVLAVARSAR